MALNADTRIVPAHGAFFFADTNTALPADPLTAFRLNGTVPDDWEQLGFTSKQNLPAFGRDGGDPTVLDAWEQDGVETIYAATNWSLGVNSLQIDENTLDMAFGGYLDTDGGNVVPAQSDGLKKALVLLAVDGTGVLLFWMPNTSSSISDAPSLDAANFFETPLSASILSADSAVITPTSTGKSGIMKIYKSGLTVAIPRIAGVTPDAAGEGDLITLVGTGFTGVSGVSVDDVDLDAAAYSFVDDLHIVVVMPAGDAGAVDITVTTAAGTSLAISYTRDV